MLKRPKKTSARSVFFVESATGPSCWTGDILAIGYSWINRMQFNSAEITLYCGDDKIIIRGRNLNSETRPQLRLFEGLTKHKVSFLQEADRSALLQSEKEVVVEAIEW
jgi:hypothetical protein